MPVIEDLRIDLLGSFIYVILILLARCWANLKMGGER